GLLGEDPAQLPVEAVDGEGGRDAVPGDVEGDDGEGALVLAAFGGSALDRGRGVEVGVEVVAADLAHRLVAVGEADGALVARDREGALVDDAGVDEFLADLLEPVLEEADGELVA